MLLAAISRFTSRLVPSVISTIRCSRNGVTSLPVRPFGLGERLRERGVVDVRLELTLRWQRVGDQHRRPPAQRVVRRHHLRDRGASGTDQSSCSPEVVSQKLGNSVVP